MTNPSRRPQVAAIAGVLGAAFLASWFSGWRDDADPWIGPANLLYVLLTAGPLAIAWLAAAAGLGWPIRRWLLPGARSPFCLQIGLGVAAMMVLDAGLGAAGLLQAGGGAGAWVLLGVGIALLAVQLRRAGRITVWPGDPAAAWIWTAAAPAGAILLVAACSAPGWLWASEFGGYDALSYHLQLPKEWLAIGRIQPLEHNVYSFLPGYVEAAYYHLAILRRDAVAAACGAQLLHAGIAVLSAVVTFGFLRRHVGAAAAAAGGVLLLATPWSIVVGSLAYNEMFVVLMLVTGLLVLEENVADWRAGTAIGLLAAAACGAKLTAAGFVALPLGVMMLIPARGAAIMTRIVSAGAVGFICLLPYLLRNQLAAGNPVFPFATDVFGTAHWTTEQVAAWRGSHFTSAGIIDRLTAAWDQLLRYGIGPNPDPSEPWKPQWSVLLWLSGIGFLLAWRRPSLKRAAVGLVIVLLVQFVFWIAFTHLKSRFFLPAVVPAVGLVGLGIGACMGGETANFRRRAITVGAALACLLSSALPVWIYRGEHAPPGPAQWIGMTDSLTGDNLPREVHLELPGEDNAPPAIVINHLRPADAMVLFVGEASPFYYTRGNFTYQTTYDRGPLSRIMRELGDDPAAWLLALRDEGYTHLLVNLEMLDLWERGGQNDPLITTKRILEAAEESAEIWWTPGAGDRLRLYRLHPVSSR